MAVDWSNLLPEMLGHIAEKCMSMNLKDFAMFSCVCCSWHEAASFVKSTLVLHQQLPWLVLPCDAGNSKDDNRNLFDLGNNKCYNLSLPEAHKKRCYGTGTQWLLMSGLDRQIHLFNPLTRALLSLPSCNTFLHPPPPLEELLDQDSDNEDEGDYWFRQYFIHRALILSLTKLLVVVIYGEFNYVAIAAAQEDNKWTPIDVDGVRDVAYAPSLGMILFLQDTGHVQCCNLHQLYDRMVPISVVNYVLPPRLILEEPHRRIPLHKKLYLLESFGNILMIERVYDKERHVTCTINAYKLNMRTKEWKEVRDLGDVALFIGSSPATSVKASKFPTSCRPNYIYFNEDGSYLYPYEFDENEIVLIDEPEGGDMGLYNLATRTIQSFYPMNDYLSYYSIPVWLMPKL